jgi:hypothetical protein
MPTYSAIATGNVSYVKINKDNYSVSLQELTNLRIKFSDFGIVDFPILTISEYPTYYLYQIAPPVSFGGYVNRFKSPTNPTTSLDKYNLLTGTSSPVFYGYTNTTGSIGSNGFYSFRDSYLPVAVSCSFSISKNNLETDKVFSIIFTSSLGVVRQQSFQLPDSMVSTTYSSSFSYIPTSSDAFTPATLGIAFASSSLSIPLEITLSSIDLIIDQYKLRSTDNNILNYYTSASNNTNQSGSILKYNSVAGNTLNYLNTSSGIYTAGDTPNIPVTISASATLNSIIGTGVTKIGLYRLLNQNDTLASLVTDFPSTAITIPSGGTGSVYLSGSFVPIENSRYAIAINDDSPSPTDITASYVSFLVTQSVSPYTSSNLTILEPFFESKFTNSDCDVLMNNAINLESNELFMKVNYNTGQLIPTNQEEILDYTAEKADVKPYNYNLLSQIIPRYNGVKVTQQEENKWTNGDIGYGKSPSVQSLNNYIAYFEWIGGTSPELIGKSAAYIKYLIDKDGNTAIPSFSSPYYYNLIDSFETNKNVILSLNTTEDSNAYKDTGPVSIIRAGTLPMPILASQTSSNASIISPIRFITSSLSIPDYTNFFYTGSGVSPNITSNNTIVLPLDVENNPGSTTTLIGNIIEIDTTSNNTQIRFLLWSGTFINQLTGGSIANFTINFQKLNGSTWSNIGTYTETSILAGNPQAATPGLANLSLFDNYGGGLSTLPLTPQENDQYRVVITNLSSAATLQVIDYAVYLLQTPSSTGISFPTTPYFTTGSNSKYILTGSDFNTFYSPGTPLTQQEITGSGYFSFLPFSIKPNDQIRFEGDENQVYNIIEAVPVSPTNTNFHMILDRNIVDGTNINSFLIRRLDPNPNFVTLDYDTSVNSVGKGFMLPQYATDELQQNYNKIIEKLKIDGLI